MAYGSIVILILLACLFYEIGRLDEDLSGGMGLAAGVLAFLFWQFVAGGGWIYLLVSAVLGYGLLTCYKIWRSAS